MLKGNYVFEIDESLDANYTDINIWEIYSVVFNIFYNLRIE
jgi:hypothetical protein